MSLCRSRIYEGYIGLRQFMLRFSSGAFHVSFVLIPFFFSHFWYSTDRLSKDERYTLYFLSHTTLRCKYNIPFDAMPLHTGFERIRLNK